MAEEEPFDEKSVLRKHLVLGYLLVVTPFMLVISLFAGGGGHGTWDVAKAFFPFGMLVAERADQITTLAVVLTLAQNPIYGAVLLQTRKRSWKKPLAIIFILHTAVMILAFNP